MALDFDILDLSPAFATTSDIAWTNDPFSASPSSLICKEKMIT